jgi:hypothetical protein
LKRVPGVHSAIHWFPGALAEIIVQILADPALFVLADFQNILFESLPLNRCGDDVGGRLKKVQVVTGENTAASRKRVQRAEWAIPTSDRDNGTAEDTTAGQFRRSLKSGLVLKVTENDRLIVKQRVASRGAGPGQNLEAANKTGRPAHSGFDQKGVTVGEEFQGAANPNIKSLSNCGDCLVQQ